MEFVWTAAGESTRSVPICSGKNGGLYTPVHVTKSGFRKSWQSATFVGTLVFTLMFKVKSFKVETFNRLPCCAILYSVWRVGLLTPRTWQQGYMQCNYILHAYTRLIATNWLKKYHEYDHLILIIYIDIFIHLNNTVYYWSWIEFKVKTNLKINRQIKSQILHF